MHFDKMPGIMRRDMKRDLVDEFKARLIRMRDANGHNDRSLSLAAGLGATAVRDILEGKSVEPRYSTIRRLSGALGCQMTDLVPDDADWPPLPSPEAAPSPNSFSDIIVERAVIACDQATLSLQKPLPPEKRAEYVVRLCRWIAGEMSRTGAAEPATSDQLRQIISFAIESNR